MLYRGRVLGDEKLSSPGFPGVKQTCSRIRGYSGPKVVHVPVASIDERACTREYRACTRVYPGGVSRRGTILPVRLILMLFFFPRFDFGFSANRRRFLPAQPGSRPCASRNSPVFSERCPAQKSASPSAQFELLQTSQNLTEKKWKYRFSCLLLCLAS